MDEQHCHAESPTLKIITTCSLAAIIGLSTPLHAAQIEKAVEDQRTGQVFGGLTGVILGGLGGPVGALAGGIAGAWLGGTAQEASGLSQRAYVVRTDEGEVQTIRAPHQQFSAGDQVTLEHGRIQESRH